MNNNKLNTAALEAHCRGVFSPAGFLDVGEDTKFADGREVVRDSYKGKQFIAPVMKSGKTPDVYFGLDDSKKHLYVAEGLPFVDTVKFAETQPKKPGRGFLTSDYNRRAEFSDTIRTEQYRTLLKHEDKLYRKRQEAEPQVLLTATLPEHKPEQETFLYDRVYDQSKPDHNTQKLTHDTTNPTCLSKERNFGKYNTTYLLNHKPPPAEQIHLPEHGRVTVAFS